MGRACLFLLQLFIGPHGFYGGLGDFIGNANFIRFAAVQQRLRIAFKLWTGLQQVVAQQIVHRNAQRVGDFTMVVRLTLVVPVSTLLMWVGDKDILSANCSCVRSNPIRAILIRLPMAL